MEVVYEDNHIIIVNKRSGEIVQGDKTGDRTLADDVKQYIKEKYGKPGEVFLGVTHRLDRPVSGLVVFARTSKALARLNRMFAEGQVHKTYWAVVEREKEREKGKVKSEEFATAANASSAGATDSSHANHHDSCSTVHDSCSTVHDSRSTVHCSLLTHWLTRNEQQNKAYAHDHEVRGAKKAQLRYRVLARGDRYSLLEVELLTGRHHQIRCQLSAIGCPIRGDLKYGARRSNADGSISLVARRIEFEHPVSHLPISLEAPLPEEALWQTLSSQIS